MGWTDPIPTQVAGVSELLASDWNTFVKDNMSSLYPLSMTIALSGEDEFVSTGNNIVTVRAPFALTLVQIPRASVSVASSSGLVTVDINEAGSTILSTKLTIDSGEKTSVTAVTPAVLSDTSIADDAELSFDVDTAGTGVKGLKVTLFFVKS
jgi:hypothetical protein